MLPFTKAHGRPWVPASGLLAGSPLGRMSDDSSLKGSVHPPNIPPGACSPEDKFSVLLISLTERAGLPREEENSLHPHTQPGAWSRAWWAAPVAGGTEGAPSLGMSTPWPAWCCKASCFWPLLPCLGRTECERIHSYTLALCSPLS